MGQLHNKGFGSITPTRWRLNGWLTALTAALCFLVLVAQVSARQVRVATFNVEVGVASPGSASYEAAKAILARIDADIIGFQELNLSSEANWRQLASELGYDHVLLGASTPSLSGGYRVGYFSRYPITDSHAILSPPGANELTRSPLRMAVNVAGAAKPLVLWNMHQKAMGGSDNQFRRAVEALRIVQDIDAYRQQNPDHDEFVMLGDLNADVFAESQVSLFNSIPSGMPASYVLGSDITFPVAYRLFPDQRYANAGGGMHRVDAFQQGNTSRATYVGRDVIYNSVLDYILVSTALRDNPLGPPAGEVYHSARDVATGGAGLPKAGAIPAATASLTASDHLAVFVDFNMTDDGGQVLSVWPDTAISVVGDPGGPFVPDRWFYTIQHENPEPLAWSASTDAPWLTLVTTNGVLPANEPFELDALLDEATMPTLPGTYFANLRIRDVSGLQSITRRVILSVRQPARLAVTPSTDFHSGGIPGGPFSPASRIYTLANTGQRPLDWAVSNAYPWLMVSPSAGTLGVGAVIAVTAVVTSAATDLDEGVFTDTLTFENLNNGDGNAVRAVSLNIGYRDYYTQAFPFGAPFALTNRTITFTPVGDGSAYDVCSIPAETLPTDPSIGTDLLLKDDSFASLTLGSGSRVPFFGASYDRLFIGSNGYITFDQGDTRLTETMSNHFARIRIAALLTDLNPGTGGVVRLLVSADRVSVSYLDVPRFPNYGANTFQIELFFDGMIRITYLGIDAYSSVVGLSAGQGIPPGFTPSDFTVYPGCLPPIFGVPFVWDVTARGATVIVPVVAEDRSRFDGYGVVIAPSETAFLPSLEDASALIVSATGALPEMMEFVVTGLVAETTYAVRAYVLEEGTPRYSGRGVFTTDVLNPGNLIPVITGPGFYAQNFNSLPSAGTITWRDNMTLPGWYAQRTGSGTTLVANAGTSTTGNLYNYGTANTTDRALGSLGSGTAGSFAWGVAVHNATDLPVTLNTLSYVGEQWRNSAAAAQNVTFSYRTGPVAITNLSPGSDAGWSAYPALDFVSPVTGGSSGALNGNDASNRSPRSAALGLVLPPGHWITFRWRDVDHSGSDHGFAIDDFLLTWTLPDLSPVITSELFAQGQVGQPFAYTITASGNPAYFDAEGLPEGLFINDQTGWINGTPLSTGSYDVVISAENTAGRDAAVLVVRIDPPAEPDPFLAWSGGQPPSDELLLRYALGGAAGMLSEGQPLQMVVEDGQVKVIALVRVNDSALSVIGETATEVEALSMPEWIDVHPGVPGPDQSDTPSGIQRREYPVASDVEDTGFLRFRIFWDAP
ncbi:MAG TPA: endonuclease/exonuclease/phosphatase family protein [Kiritimatiellia bacterium]|nr:endonuclease/exonuclease/phosphatase family protein [Kiritimatiellia bacterium]HMO98216.1 endonuclease/exonuclease/phosphatase family protein [Kiritimatiellia bacterium]